jgi:hypothetical protein
MFRPCEDPTVLDSRNVLHTVHRKTWQSSGMCYRVYQHPSALLHGAEQPQISDCNFIPVYNHNVICPPSCGTRRYKLILMLIDCRFCECHRTILIFKTIVLNMEVLHL